VSLAVLAAFEAALALDSDAGRDESPEVLCQALVPGWSEVPVKTPLRFRDLAGTLQAAISAR